MRALSALSNSVIYVPIFSLETANSSSDSKRIKIVTAVEGEKKLVDVFTEENKFFAWVGARTYQCFSVAAGDLALTLPRDRFVRLDPGSDYEQTFSPDDLEFLAYPILENAMCDSTEAAQGEGDLLPHSFGEETREELSETEIQAMLGELRRVLGHFVSIDEAYFVDFNGEGVLGILGEDMPSEERFGLIERVADIARKYFSEAGAISVYDDLSSPVSRSWELFTAQAPFYSRSTAEDLPTHPQADLLSGREETLEEDSTMERGSLWQRLRQRYRL